MHYNRDLHKNKVIFLLARFFYDTMYLPDIIKLFEGDK